MQRRFPLIKLFILLAIPSLILGCGSGGGGDEDEFLGAAIVTISTSPTEIDTGDRTEVRVKITDVDKNGILLKLLYPDALDYVPNSSFLRVDSVEGDFPPSIITTVDSDNFLVFFIARSDVSDDNEATLSFQLEANKILEDGEISVDADIDDPSVSNDVEFDPDTPEFGAEDSTTITVVD